MVYTRIAKVRDVCYNVGMNIGNLNVTGRALCAPMAGISDPIYRLLARRLGAVVVYTEMVSANGLVRENRKTAAMLHFDEAERPIGLQLFGADPDVMHQAARLASAMAPDLIDINFGCPVKKVVKRNGGAAMLKDLGLTRALVAAVVAGSTVPVTVKLRSGWDEETKVFAEAGRAAAEAGAAAVTLHARTRSSLFGGRACWDDIRRLKEAVAIPVIGNGDVVTPQDALRMIEETGCDAVMIGRAAMGNPWIFREVNQYLETGRLLPPPTLEEKIELILEHARLLMAAHGERTALLKMRGNLAHYSRGWRRAGQLRQTMMKIETFASLQELLRDFIAPSQPEIKPRPGPALDL